MNTPLVWNWQVVEFIRRKRRTMTLQELSDRTGLSVPSLNQYEHGKHEIPIYALERLVKGLDCQPEEIIPGLSQGAKAPPIPNNRSLAQKRRAPYTGRKKRRARRTAAS